MSTPNAPKRSIWLQLLLGLGALLLGGLVFVKMACTKVIRVDPIPQEQALSQAPTLHNLIDPIMRKLVDQEGMVDYATLRKDPSVVNKYLAIAAQVSPSSHPGKFPSQTHKLTYWINAYNVAILKSVLLHPTWKDLNSTARKAEFFVFSQFVFGGQSINLQNLENKIIRERFKEPRIHFAINCASFGCPKLPAEAFTPQKLEEQLQRETKRFLNEKRNVMVDNTRKQIMLSSILKWFRGDFTNYLQRKKITGPGDPILTYVNLYRKEGAKVPTKGYAIQYRTYDWRLNDQAGPKRDL